MHVFVSAQAGFIMARILGCPPSPLYSLDWTRHTYYLSGLPDILSQGANSRCDAVSRMIGDMLDQNAQRYGESESVVKRPQRTETLRQSREAKLQASNVEQLLNGTDVTYAQRSLILPNTPV
jgi:hypothetical protein